MQTARIELASKNDSPNRARRLLIGGVIAALLLAVGVPLGLHQSNRAALADEARESAASLAAALDAAGGARSAYEARLAETVEFSERVLAPVAASASDASQFSEEAVVVLQENVTLFAEYGTADETTPVSLDRSQSSSEAIERELTQAYLEADDVEVERARVDSEISRLRALADDYEARTAELDASLPAAVEAIRAVAEAGGAAGEATLAAHERASEDSRTRLSAAIQALRDLSAALGAPDITPAIVATELQPAAVLDDYAGTAEGVRASQAEVLAAEAAAAQEAARNAPRQSSPGTGSRVCTYLGFGGTVNFKPC